MSAKARGTILWDFDGTLARMVRFAVLDVLDSAMLGHGRSAEEIGARLRAGYPWHTPEIPHPALNSPHAWWWHMESVFDRSLADLGLPETAAAALSVRVRERIIDPAAYEVFADAEPALARLRRAGWRHAIVSNRVPELYSVAQAAAQAPALWMVCDSVLMDVVAAERVGLRGILVRAVDPRARRRAEDLGAAADLILTARG